MCVICVLKPGYVPSQKLITNAVLNNPDGFGLIIKDRGKLEVIKDCDVSKGNDPDRIYGELCVAQEHQRILHVRKNTVGRTELANTHPFTVMKALDGRHIEFMHNGTLHKWRPGAESTLSDSHNFALSFMSPLLYRFTSPENGLGDYTDKFFNNLLGDTFGTMNRGLLVANDLDPVLLGKWEEIGDGDEKFWASNNDYFNYSINNRMHESQKPKTQVIVRQPEPSAAEGVPNGGTKEENIGNGRSSTSNVPRRTVGALKEVNLSKTNGRPLSVKDLENLYSWGTDDIEDLDEESISYMGYLGMKEINNYVNTNPEGAGLLIEFLARKYAALFEDFVNTDELRVKAVDKHEKATNVNSALAFELNEAKKLIESLRKELANSVRSKEAQVG